MNLLKKIAKTQRFSYVVDDRSILEVLSSEPKGVSVNYTLIESCCAGLKSFEKSIKHSLKARK